MQSHQTIRLSGGAHRSPDQGVCVMELASMLAGEEFSDRPATVSPVLGRFLRCYNDRLDDDRRQDLYPIASRVVGTAATKAVEGSRVRVRPGLSAGSVAARTAAQDASDDGHRRALELVDELVALGDSWAGIPADPSELMHPPERITDG